LTGTLNRRAFYEFAELQMAALNRAFRPFAVILFDIDNFKNINDQHGHHVGDLLLQVVTSTIRALIRSNDRLVRLGGDEFMLFLPETGTNGLRTIASRLSKNLNRVMDENKWPVSFSLGVITFIKIPSSVDEIIHVADKLMYEAKKDGKNTIRYGNYE
jgi:diguanylate cyclase (GGDEF)-like protein